MRQFAGGRLEVYLDLDGRGLVVASTGVPFFDHLLEQAGDHGRLDLRVNVEGEVAGDVGGTVSEVGAAVGQALASALGEKVGIARFGDAIVPDGDALVRLAMDLSCGPYYVYGVEMSPLSLGNYDAALTERVLREVVTKAGITMHVKKLAGDSHHHVQGAVFKSFAVALHRAALRSDPFEGVVTSAGEGPK